ncbi:hypothetical protein [Nonomuraea gerenzanensis]|uniref:hypothetical protein n=1 Tax=Nonomuraea gerenzanensis TaxID=93944 RepID=UPI001CD948A0|nr:hypothetical protein [Nonomuraea gerenzanensis]UBU12922.1 hypothetical protein LCN96_53225 [Nonomuraea gerenzanensis]
MLDLDLDELYALLGPHIAAGDVWFPASQSYSLQIPEGPVGVWQAVAGLPAFPVSAANGDYVELSLSFDWSTGGNTSFNMAVAVVDANKRIIRFVHSAADLQGGMKPLPYMDPSLQNMAASTPRVWPYLVQESDVADDGLLRLALVSVDRAPRAVGATPPTIWGYDGSWPMRWRLTNYRRAASFTNHDRFGLRIEDHS